VISGVLVGNIEAQEAVHITEQGRVVGDIAAPRVILVDGASFRGNIDMGDFDIEREIPISETRREPVARPAAAEERAEAPAERAAPARRRPAPKPARTPARKAAKPKAKKKPPAPKVRSVGKSKARKKKKR
jgi:hypothetical protein